jgi:transcriptional regulator GlxA family with amidase domain
MRTSSRPVALLLFDEVELLDVTGPLAVLTEAGRQYNWRAFKIFTTATRRGPIETRSQLRLEAAQDLASCPPTEILIVPGGYGARKAADDAAIVAWVAERAASAEFVAAVGLGCLVLARAGMLDGLSVAATPGNAELVAAMAPLAQPATDRTVIRGGKVLTASTTFAGIDLGLEIVAATLGDKQAAGAASRLGYAWRKLEIPAIG